MGLYRTGSLSNYRLIRRTKHEPGEMNKLRFRDLIPHNHLMHDVTDVRVRWLMLCIFIYTVYLTFKVLNGIYAVARKVSLSLFVVLVDGVVVLYL
jgi:hypothetical protein